MAAQKVSLESTLPTDPSLRSGVRLEARAALMNAVAALSRTPSPARAVVRLAMLEGRENVDALAAIELASRPTPGSPVALDPSRSLAEGDLETLIRLGWVEALDAKGDHAAARTELDAARKRVLERCGDNRR